MNLDQLDYYVEHRQEILVSSIDQVCQGVGSGHGKVCTFQDCLRMFLAIDPHGDIFSCQRFCGQKEYRLGNITDLPTWTGLMGSPMGRKMLGREIAVQESCSKCVHIDHCKGGCFYNALTNDQSGRVKDPYCSAYRDFFDCIQKRLLEEMGSDDNINAVAEQSYQGKGHPLLKKGPLIELVREGPHPSHVARTAKRIVAAVELARGPDIPSVASRLVENGIARTQRSGEASLEALRGRLQPRTGILNNIYMHVTFSCQLNCTHCYAHADNDNEEQNDTPVKAVEDLIRQAKAAGFRQFIITGGEPLVHHQRDKLLQMLASVRSWVAPMNIVLRTNLTMPLEPRELAAIARSVDRVVASVDGNEKTHDNRRGRGTYTSVVRNLEEYQSIASSIGNAGELSLATAMHSSDIQGPPGDAARQLADKLGIKRTRFRPILPLGRAMDWDEPPSSEALGGHASPMELIEGGFHPVSSCGLGQNLYVEPSGQSFPCYAYNKPHSHLGNAIEGGLQPILKSPTFKNQACHNVDTNRKCGACELRYLCGGACRAWGGEQTQCNLDVPPPECLGLEARASALLLAAMEYLNLHEVGG